MATATASQDDDLLIITDDNNDTNTETSDIIEFSFDDQGTNQNKVQSEDTIDTSLEGDKGTPMPNSLETENFSFDIIENTENKQNLETEEIQTEKTLKEDLNLGFGDISIPAESPKDLANTFSIESTGNMNDILTKTIAELTARKDIITGEKSSKSDDIISLTKQIKELQDEVKQLEAESAMLDGESDKITANITKLESMKLDPIKDHNAKRGVKK